MPSGPAPLAVVVRRPPTPPVSRDRANDALDSQYRSNLISISIRPKIQYSASGERSRTTVAAVLWVLVDRRRGRGRSLRRRDGWSCDLDGRVTWMVM